MTGKVGEFCYREPVGTLEAAEVVCGQIDWANWVRNKQGWWMAGWLHGKW